MPQQLVLHRFRKRSTIAFVYIALISIVAWGWSWLFAVPGTCFDGAKNQNETGVDCGGVCGACAATYKAPSEIEIRSTQLVYGGVNTYDVVAQIFNPNAEDGAGNFEYSFDLKDEQGQVITTRKGRNFVLPGETKYIIETQLESQTIPKSIVFKMNNPEWKHFVGGYQERPALNVYSKHYDRITDGVGFGAATGLLVNESPFDFVNVKIKVLLFDTTDKPVAVNTTELQTVQSGEKRDFRLVWPTAFPGEVTRMETEAEADVYHSDNFVKKYFPNSRF
jgi:hypothetical protein